MHRCFYVIALTLALALAVGVEAPKAQPKKAGSSTSSASVAKTLEAKIEKLWQDFKDHKKDAFAAVLADDATEFWVDGKLRDKATAVKDVDIVMLNNYTLSNIKIVSLGSAAALATYRVKAAGTFKPTVSLT
jgi:hypothetical protein